MMKFFRFLNIAISISDTIYSFTHDANLKIVELKIYYIPITKKYMCKVIYSNGDKYRIQSNGDFFKID